MEYPEILHHAFHGRYTLVVQIQKRKLLKREKETQIYYRAAVLSINH